MIKAYYCSFTVKFHYQPVQSKILLPFLMLLTGVVYTVHWIFTKDLNYGIESRIIFALFLKVLLSSCIHLGSLNSLRSLLSE